MTKMKKVVLVMLLVLICSASMVFAQSIRERREIKVVYTNDVHCGYKTNIGYAGLASVINDLKEDHKYVTVIDNGDAVQGEAIGTVSKGEYIVDIMNAVGFDYCLFGNHEFDYGMDQLKELVKMNNAQYLAANIHYSGNKEGLSFKPYAIEDYDGIKVAFIGLATPESITKSTPTYFKEDGVYVYEFDAGEELYATTQKYVNEVRALGADYVVVCGHLGLEEGSEPNRASDVIANTNGIDVFLDAHSHTVMEAGSFKNKDGKDVVYSQTGTKLEHVGVLSINVATGEIKTEFADTEAKDAKIQAVVDAIDKEYESFILEQVATSDIYLSVKTNGVRAVRNRETAIGDLCADAYRVVSGADIGFSNGGGIRADIKNGPITLKDIINVFPYGNALVVVECTGQEILDALEWGSKSTQKEASDGTNALGESGGFLQVSGLKYTIDTSIKSTCTQDEKGMFTGVAGARRVKDVFVGTDETGYTPIDPNGTYTLGCHNYKLKSAGDGYTMFTDNKIIIDESMIDNQLLISYIVDTLGGTIGEEYAEPQGRITII